MRQVILDTETTGLSALEGHRIIEIGCIELEDRRYTGRQLHHYVNPQRSSDPDAVRVHGITDEFLADKPPFAAVAEEVLAFVTGAELVIHNAEFDLAFLDAEMARLGRPAIRQLAAGVVDTLAMAREQYPGKVNKLDALCKRLEVDNSHRELHGALLDAGLLAEVYLRMTRGQGSLVIDEGGQGRGPARRHATDLRALPLAVLRASAEEIEAHEAMLADIDKASNGKTLWRQREGNAA